MLPGNCNRENPFEQDEQTAVVKGLKIFWPDLCEVALAFEKCGHRSEEGLADPLIGLFVVPEVEQLVFYDRAADGAAELVLTQLWDWEALIVEVVLGIKVAISKKFVGRSMQLVRSILSDQQNLCARTGAEFR
jgi:hypothetical protein